MFGNKRGPRKGPLPFRYVFVLSIAIFSLLTAQGLLLVNKGIKPTIMEIAVVRTEQIAKEALNDAVDKKIAEADLENILVIHEGGGASINGELFNRATSEAISRVETYLDKANKGILDQWLASEDIEVKMEDGPKIVGEVAKIPLGQATGIALFSNLGPKIPIRLVPMGSVEVTPLLQSEVKGINMQNVILKIEIKVQVQVVIPFETDVTTVTTQVFLDGEVIEGDVPEIYAPGGGLEPSIPIVPNQNNTTENEQN
jgi:sporulation protein YunB